MIFMQRADENHLITEVTEYTNGIFFHLFRGGIFRPRGFHSVITVRPSVHRSWALSWWQ